MDRLLCRFLFALLGHRICCGRIPEWTDRVGQTWDTYDIAPWNLYNIIWSYQYWIRSRVD